jgi:hypothetical protein
MRFFPLLIAVVVALVFALQWDQDLIPVNDGYGWDGNMYGMYTQYWDQAVEQKAINAYRMQRMLVPAALAQLLPMLQMETTPANIIQAYRVVNTLSAALALVFFLLLARSARWDWQRTTLGLGALLLSAPVLKISLFYPITPDMPALAFGMMAVYFWYKGWQPLLLTLILVGCFTAPTMILFGLLLVFPREKPDMVSTLPRWVIVLPPLLFLIAWTTVWILYPETFSRPPSQSHPVQMPWLPLSIPFMLLYAVGIGFLFQKLDPAHLLRTSVRQWWWIPLVIAGFAATRYLIQIWAGPEAAPQTISSYLRLLLAQSVTWPGVSVVAHFVYFPGMVLLLLISGRQLPQAVVGLGWGAWLLLLVSAVLFTGSETRQLIQLVPFLIFVGVHALGKGAFFPTWFIGLWTFILLAASRFWIKMGYPGSLDGNFLEEPAQRYFQFHGPWMNGPSWGFGLVGLLFIAALLGFLQFYGWIRIARPKSEKQTFS